MRAPAALTPRNGQALVAGTVARISGCANQQELGLEDQQDHVKAVVEELYDGPVAYHVITATGKGERLDRSELAEVERLIRDRELGLPAMEDVGRLDRGGLPLLRLSGE